jgi:hypothetical protein
MRVYWTQSMSDQSHNVLEQIILYIIMWCFSILVLEHWERQKQQTNTPKPQKNVASPKKIKYMNHIFHICINWRVDFLPCILHWRGKSCISAFKNMFFSFFYFFLFSIEGLYLNWMDYVPERIHFRINCNILFLNRGCRINFHDTWIQSNNIWHHCEGTYLACCS